MTYTTSEAHQLLQGWPVQIPVTDLKPFRNRVRVLTEVLDDANEIALVKAAFESKGWLVRRPGEDEVRGLPGKDRVWLVVEVRFGGYPRGGARVAVKRVEEAADRFHLGIWVRYAEVIRFPREPERTYYIDKGAKRSSTEHVVLQRVLRLADRPQTTRLIRLPACVREADVRAELARHAPNSPFDPYRDSIRPAVQGLPEGEGEVLDPGSPSWRMRLVGVVLAISLGVPVAWMPGTMWKLFLVVLACLTTTAAFGSAAPAGQKAAQRLSIGLAFALEITLPSILLGTAIHREQAPPLIIAAYVFITGPGMVHALRNWGLSRHLSWLIPLAVTVLAPVALGLGGMFDIEYLGHRFGIPAGAVSLPTYWRVAIITKPILFGIAVFLLLVACLGWAHYFDLFSTDTVTRGLTVLIAASIASLSLLTAISIGLESVDNAAQVAAADARAGRQPAAYFGLQGTLICVRPVNSPIAVYNGPLPANRPVLSFGFTGTQLWVWDPKSVRAISVPMQDVTTAPAMGTPAHC
jgi:hypothetical protein